MDRDVSVESARSVDVQLSPVSDVDMKWLSDSDVVGHCGPRLTPASWAGVLLGESGMGMLARVGGAEG